jgi:hypothetical protein
MNKKDYERENVFEYYNDFAIPRRKFAPESKLGEWYWRGLDLARWVSRRFYAVRLFYKGFTDYFQED